MPTLQTDPQGGMKSLSPAHEAILVIAEDPAAAAPKSHRMGGADRVIDLNPSEASASTEAVALSTGQIQLVLQGRLKAWTRRIKRQCCTSACRVCKEHGDSSVGIRQTFQAARGALQRGTAWPRFWPWIWFRSST